MVYQIFHGDAAGIALLFLRHELLTHLPDAFVPPGLRVPRNWVFYSLLFYPTVTWILYGQMTGLLLLIFVGTFIFLRRGRDFAAGAVWGLLLFKPQLAITLAVILLVKGRWRALAGGAVTVTAWLSTGLILGWQSFRQYLHLSGQLMDLLRLDSYESWGLQNFYGFSILLFNDISPSLTTLLTDATNWKANRTGFSDPYTAVSTWGTNSVGPWGTRGGIDASATWIWSGDNDTNDNAYFSTKISANHAVPEPTSIGLLGIALAGLGLAQARKHKTLG